MLSKQALKTWITGHGFAVSDSRTGKELIVEIPFTLESGHAKLRGVDRIAVRTLAEAKRVLAVNQQ